MVWTFLSYLAAFIIPGFYRRIQAKNLHHLKVKGPVIIAMNHPNAFSDPLGLTYLYLPHKLKYLARGDAFKPGFMSWFLRSIGIIPIFRIQDAGKEGLKKNDDAYQKVNAFLQANAKVIVFAEGICIQERRLRPLKKGVARMVFGAYDAIRRDDLVVVPVGVNYSKPHQFRSDVFFNIGDPIPVKDFIEEYNQSQARAYNKFLQLLEGKMRALVTHIEHPSNDQLVLQVEEIRKKELMHEQGMQESDLSFDFETLNYLTEKVNRAERENKPLLEEFRQRSEAYHSQLNALKWEDWFFAGKYDSRNLIFLLVARFILILIGLPFYIGGLVFNLYPYLIAKRMTGKMVKAIEFYSSFVIGLGFVLLFLNYLVIFVVATILLNSSFLGFLVCVCSGLLGWFALHFHPLIISTIKLTSFWKGSEHWLPLRSQRIELVNLINKF
jgi:glycerol-3-phosphate O-acyltransferase/dihydroxyacetone phosphate acyltransferase